MKIFTAGFVSESSDLTPIATTIDDWRIEDSRDRVLNPTIIAKALNIFRTRAHSKGWEVAQSICATAFPPGGRSARSVYENIRSTITDDLKSAMPVDAVLLQLHGAAMAYGYDDCEGDLLTHIRDIAGSDVPIGIELDPHCHISQMMMDKATVIVLYKTMRHTDIAERAIELFELIEGTLEGRLLPTMSLFDCRLMNSSGFDEQQNPMKPFFEQICALQRSKRVLSISPVHCFPMANIPDMGCKMLVITDNSPKLAAELSQKLGMDFHSIGKDLLQNIGFDPSLEQAKGLADKGVVSIPLIDFGDLGGCGFPMDNTELLQAMLQRGMTNTVVGLLWDPLAVSICHGSGINAQLNLRIGDNASHSSGPPLDLSVTVHRLYKNIDLTQWDGGVVSCDAAAIRNGETEILLVSKRILGNGLFSLIELGVNPNEKQYLLLKYLLDAPNSIQVFGPNCDYKSWPIDRIKRPKWPWDEYPFKSDTHHRISYD